jgi:peptidoglycan/LPS O-acetylase OafA/YrhL
VSFLQNFKDNPTFINAIIFAMRRVIGIAYFYYINLILIVYLFRSLGTGPTWHFFDKIMSKCDESIWKNLLFINNLSQDLISKDDICLYWTWYLSLYVQLSVLTPFVIYLMKKIMVVCYPLLIILALICGGVIGLQIWVDQSGISPAYNPQYFAHVYIKPWQHFTEFIVFGVVFGIFLNEYIEKRKRIDLGDRHENSVSYTILKYIKKKLILRVIINLIGFSAIIGMNVLVWLYHSD